MGLRGPKPGTKPQGKTGGRKKGTPNRITKDLKSMILGALSDEGGQSYLAKVAQENPVAFCTLLGKVLPMTVASDPDQPVKVVIEWAASSE